MQKSTKFFHHGKSYKSDYLNTTDGHEIYYSCYGNPRGKPVIILHGGPGYGSDVTQTRFFNPQKWNILFFDQRGTGLSRPKGDITNNTTQHLVNDISMIADEMGFKDFMLKGASWGTTLALAYAQQYPERVRSLLLVGVFLGDKNESLITRLDGVERHFPDLWQYFISPLSSVEREKPFLAYHKHIFSGTNEEKNLFSREAIALELATECMGITRENALEECNKLDFYNIARIEYHYLANNYFLTQDQILNSCAVIRDIPTTILHGRYDMICPPRGAWKLAQSLDKCNLYFVDPAGHCESEPKTSSLLIKVIEDHLGV